MSKIGKINISIPEKVKVALAGNIINIEGPLGKKSINIDLGCLIWILKKEKRFQ
jgi:large subunit ribosomal protein L6